MFTVTVVQVSTPSHALPSLHESVGVFAHENWQFVSQPLPATLLPDPKSHCSPISVTPLPHTADGATHDPFEHTRFVPHVMPLSAVSATAAQAFDALHVCF